MAGICFITLSNNTTLHSQTKVHYTSSVKTFSIKTIRLHYQETQEVKCISVKFEVVCDKTWGDGGLSSWPFTQMPLLQGSHQPANHSVWPLTLHVIGNHCHGMFWLVEMAQSQQVRLWLRVKWNIKLSLWEATSMFTIINEIQECLNSNFTKKYVYKNGL